MFGFGFFGVAQVCPIDIRAQFFAADDARRFTLQGDAEIGAELLSSAACLSQVARGGFAAPGVCTLFGGWKVV